MDVQNPFIISKFKGFDPEIYTGGGGANNASRGEYPQTRYILIWNKHYVLININNYEYEKYKILHTVFITSIAVYGCEDNFDPKLYGTLNRKTILRQRVNMKITL